MCVLSLSRVRLLQPRLEPARLLCPWHSPGKNSSVGSHAFLQGIFLTQGSKPGLLHCRQVRHHLSHWGAHGRPQTAVCCCVSVTVHWPSVAPRRGLCIQGPDAEHVLGSGVSSSSALALLKGLGTGGYQRGVGVGPGRGLCPGRGGKAGTD